MMRTCAKIAASLVALLIVPALAQDRKVYLDWAPKPDTMKAYTNPNKPITRIAEVLAKHTGQRNWSEPVLLTDRYAARWVQMAPGEKTRTQFYGDDRTVWVVWGGKIRFTIQGQAPFVATKGFLVQVPLRVPYSLETIGGEPSLRFEVTRGGALPSYPAMADDIAPPPHDGQHYIKVSYPSTLVAGGMDSYTTVNKSALDFFQDIVAAYPNGGGARLTFFVKDADNQAAIIRGMGVSTPPETNKGHFHVGNDEFWFIPEGKIDFLMEGAGLLTAGPGDVVLALPGRFHRASFAPGQMDTRIAFNRSPTMLHNYAEDANGTQ